MPLTAADVRAIAFSTPSPGRRGYNAEEVDAFLVRIEAHLAGALAAPLTVSEVRDVRFTSPRFVDRYDEDEVDAYLDLVIDELRGVGAAGAQPAAEPARVARAAPGRAPSRVAGWVTGLAVRGLPASQRARYGEEFAAELHDLAGARWWRQWAHALRQVVRTASLRRVLTGRSTRYPARER